MELSARKVRTLVFPIGEQKYTVYPVGVDDGLELSRILTEPPAKNAKIKTTELFAKVMGRTDPNDDTSPMVWDSMRQHGVPLNDAFRAGMACLAHFQTLLSDSSPGAWDAAEAAATAVWESGVRPEAVAAFQAAISQTTPPSTPPAAATTTRKPASGSGTRTRKATAKKTANRSAGRRSSGSAR